MQIYNQYCIKQIKRNIFYWRNKKLDFQKYKDNTQIAVNKAILHNQHRALLPINKEQLFLYYAIGKFVSQNSREDYRGKRVIEQIAGLLQQELPGLRGFSATKIKNMRIFFEEWSAFFNRSSLEEETLSTENQKFEFRQSLTDEFTSDNFTRIGFTHHLEILFKVKVHRVTFRGHPATLTLRGLILSIFHTMVSDIRFLCALNI